MSSKNVPIRFEITIIDVNTYNKCFGIVIRVIQVYNTFIYCMATLTWVIKIIGDRSSHISLKTNTHTAYDNHLHPSLISRIRDRVVRGDDCWSEHCRFESLNFSAFFYLHFINPNHHGCRGATLFCVFYVNTGIFIMPIYT